MARIKGAMMTRKRRNKVLKAAKGYWGAKSKHFKMAKQAVMKSGNYAFIGRKQKKRDFRRLWITRISAQAKVNGMNYSTFICGLKKAKQAVMKSGNYAFAGRKLKKRDFRSLWIARINAQAKVNGINYSQFMHGLKKAGIDLNRKMLAELAVNDKAAFASLVEQAKAAL